MKIGSYLLAAAAATALMGSAAAAEPDERPVFEIGLGGFGTIGPEYYGSDHESAGGFPVVYFSYRGKDFSILSNGLFDVEAGNTDRFDFSLSLDGNGKVDSKYRLGLHSVDYEGELGPQITIGLFYDGHQRLEASIAARAAYVLGQGFRGYVIQPELAYLTTISDSTRLGFSVSPKFGFGRYNDIYYSTPTYDAGTGYIGTDISVRVVNDLTEQLRLSGEVRAISLSGAENQDSPLFHRDWNYYARIGFTWSFYQSDEMTHR